MLRHSCFRAYNVIELCKFSSLFSKQLVLEKRCYHRSGIYDDENSDPSSSQQFSERTPFNEQKKNQFYRSGHQYNNYNNRSFGNRNSRNLNFFNNRPSSRFGEENGRNLKDATFEENELEPIEKYLYVEHSDVNQRSDEEIEAYRKEACMKITGANIPKPILNFEELCLPDNLKQVVLGSGYDKPTPIQSQGWPIALSGRNMVGISQTGSGKTLVFMIPAVIHALNQTSFETKGHERSPQVLVLAPTRELVQQISQVGCHLGDASGLITATAYGGASRNVQLQCLRGAHICVATPGRLIDFVAEGLVNLKKCTYLVLDEADRMLDMGFEPQIRKIVGQIRPDRQTLMWSATWPQDIQGLAEDFLEDYVKVTIGTGKLAANPKIEQNIYMMDEMEKEDRLLNLLLEIQSEKKPCKALIFAATKRTVDYLGSKLNRHGVKSFVLHGDISQTKRDYVIDQFRKRDCILIATDVAARGLDIVDVQHVVNYDFPTNIADYIHRIGRTARGFSSGVSHSFFTGENAGVASDLIDVLEQAKQTVNPQLYNLVGPKHHHQRGFQQRSHRHSRPFQRQRFDYSF